MAIDLSLTGRQRDSIIESTVTLGQAVQAVCKSDGSDIGGGEVEGDIADGSADSGNPVKIGGVAQDPSALPSAVSVGDRVNSSWSLNGELLVYSSRLLSGENQSANVLAITHKSIAGNDYTNSKYQNNSFTAASISATAGNVLRIRATNTTASVRYLQFHNRATPPGGGETAQEKFVIPAGSQIIIGPADLGTCGIYFATGIAVANSTALTTYTAGSAGDIVLDMDYVA